jgi:hypothetical protein
MKTKLLFSLALAAILSTLLSGCVVALGNRVPPDDRKATLGKQLTDLKQARDSGAITEEEYQTARKRILEGK